MKLKEKMRHLPIVIFILFMLGMVIHYVTLSARDLVFMDYWRNTVNLVEPTINGTLGFKELFSSSLGQRNFFQLFLVAFNIRFTQYNSLWESYAGVIVIALTCLLLYFNYIKRFSAEKQTVKGSLVLQLLFVPIVLFAYNLNQWEILSLEFSFSFMLRILFFVVIFWWIDEALGRSAWRIGEFAGIGSLTAFVILFMSQLYFPAMVLSVVVVFVLVAFLKKASWRDKLKIFGAFLTPCLIGIIIYFSGGNIASITNGGEGGIGAALINADLYKGVLYMLTASVFHQTQTGAWSEPKILLVGLLLLLIVALAAFFYFKEKMYEKTYMPLMLAAYGLLSTPIIIYGRLSYGISYLLSSRYVVETTFIWIGCLWVFSYVICMHASALKKAIPALCTILVVILVIKVDHTEWGIAPYRGFGKDYAIQMITEQELESLTDEDLAALQAPVDTVRKGIELLRKYKLNVFRESQ